MIKVKLSYHESRCLLGSRTSEFVIFFIPKSLDFLQQLLLLNFQAKDDEFHAAIAKNLEEACKLVEIGFEYVCDVDNAKVFRKRK